MRLPEKGEGTVLLKEMSDDDLIFLINSGSKLAEQVFYRRYSVYAREIAKSYYIDFKDSGISEDDFYAIAFSKTHDALNSYGDKRKKFLLYWKIVVRNAIYDYVRDNSYTLGARALAGTSFDEIRYMNNEHVLFHDIYGEEERNDDSLLKFIEGYVYGTSKYLNYREKMVADLLYFQEKTPLEILKETNWSRGTLSYVMKMTKEKIQKIIKENYL